MKGLKVGSDVLTLLAFVLFVLAAVTSTAALWVLGSVSLVGAVVLTVAKRRAEKAGRASVQT